VKDKNFILKISNQEIPKYKHQITSCTSSNPGYPDSDKISNQEIPKNKHQITSCTSSNPGYPDSDKISIYEQNPTHSHTPRSQKLRFSKR
jgi:hypothetical protein